MPILNACDFAYAPGNITIEEFYQRLYAKGVRVVQRYLWRGGKGVTPREVIAAKNAGPDGIRIVYGYEENANSWRGGAAAGVRHAAEANAIADDLGLPHGEPIYYAIDEDAHGLGMIDVALAYVHAANTPNHPSRPYGQYAVAEAFKRPTFQTYAWPPRNPDGSYQFGAVSKYAALYQWHNSQPLAGGIVDYCEIRDPAALGLIPAPDPNDLMEVISNMDGAPTHYSTLVSDVADEVRKRLDPDGDGKVHSRINDLVLDGGSKPGEGSGVRLSWVVERVVRAVLIEAGHKIAAEPAELAHAEPARHPSPTPKG